MERAPTVVPRVRKIDNDNNGSHCGSGESCCGSNKCALNCIREHCSSDSDCARGESCRYFTGAPRRKSCAQNLCKYHSQCGVGESCCDLARGAGTCSRSCVGKSCTDALRIR